MVALLVLASTHEACEIALASRLDAIRTSASCPTSPNSRGTGQTGSCRARSRSRQTSRPMIGFYPPLAREGHDGHDHGRRNLPRLLADRTAPAQRRAQLAAHRPSPPIATGGRPRAIAALMEIEVAERAYAASSVIAINPKRRPEKPSPASISTSPRGCATATSSSAPAETGSGTATISCCSGKRHGQESRRYGGRLPCPHRRGKAGVVHADHRYRPTASDRAA